MRFYKYHGLGNDYIVLDPSGFGHDLTEEKIRMICHRNFGVGSDGILFGPIDHSECDFSLRIFNPDGSEAEKSGNGLRIFARYLWDSQKVTEEPFTVFTEGGKVLCMVEDNGENIKVEMGSVSFDSAKIPVEGPDREVINENISIEGSMLTYCAATVGNPHCVILRDTAREEDARNFGPLIEKNFRFPNKTNVQFMEIIDRANIRIEIWERGAGYTLASGSSASASAAVAVKLDHCDSNITVHMPGGKLAIMVSDDFSIYMSGPVLKIAEGTLSEDMFKQEF